MPISLLGWLALPRCDSIVASPVPGCCSPNQHRIVSGLVGGSVPGDTIDGQPCQLFSYLCWCLAAILGSEGKEPFYTRHRHMTMTMTMTNYYHNQYYVRAVLHSCNIKLDLLKPGDTVELTL